MLTTATQSSPRPRLPDGVRIYAISDVHGCAHLLEQMFVVIDADMSNSRPYRAIEVFLGDYIDRGPDSRRTLDLLIGRSRRRNTVFLKGNHEAYFTSVLDDPSRVADWFGFGGLQTMMSYGVSASPNLTKYEQSDLVRELTSAMPPQHIAFLRQLRPTFTCGDFFFVHAGVRPGVPLSEQREQDLLWIRDEFLRSKKRFGKYIVHGHTPVRQAELLENRANIDTGAYATGNLTLLSIQGSSMLAI
ncbi:MULTISPECIES: metallophosphoesterase family protein [unclassified Bradyrhizobium]|uniref:metallophosphoesterase family protein n=1 Tax=unclassified Bradyrhizobium TaxID=2631580 RepID=UPI002479BFE5|nr:MULTISPECIES: metallophosphoesterase family protein [unclassified Bradyrhizobium]WGR73498.1 serine/threonine protein phosphatase [Bradyrhizobium sp. ISRA426]WGR78335.1 serine/threonine protein phosphatase [Bradyrhizobium sp. ISRA430]WGR88736.1 serine/threonine protein phosphatase [Bradyrhizobium sp. ISRA432]